MQIKLDRVYVDRTLRTIHTAELSNDSSDYYCKIDPVQESKKQSANNLYKYSLTEEGTYFTSGSKDKKDAIVEINETIIKGVDPLYMLSDLFEQCWITEEKNIRLQTRSNWICAKYKPKNSLINIDESMQRRVILVKFSFSCDQRLSKKYNKLFDILKRTKKNAKSN